MNEQEAAALRQHMVLEIAAQTVLAGERIGKYNLDARVMEILGRVPRHEFVPLEIQPYAYLNRPLPIGFDKTISQPFIVALMTDMLEIRKEDVVLEIGTGLGYQAAVLAELAHKVYSVEIIEALAQQAVKRLSRAGYNNVEVTVANGSHGLPAHAPYDKVMVTAAPDLIPSALINQLKPGGRMMIPAGLSDNQQLILVEKNANGRLSTREILPVRFSQLEGAESF
ncbi:MAG TPA: protein-L-isoaspartate(D-aspartate) O-methyltransferase [Burkholderiales bacterium]|jgi:protein-L-isoaspartate(D-aspartate) O-methyltransferase|nr:protein-L-isoaspartate(D-aspartate) O-methyltransferase [Burkholderiales bacterium]